MEADGGRDWRIEISLLARLAIDIQTSISRRASIRQKKRQPVTFVSTCTRLFVHTSVNTYPGLLQAALRTFDPFQHFHTILTSAKRFLASCVSPAARSPSTPPRWIADNFVFEMLTLPAIIDANRHRVYDRWISDSPRGNFELETSKKHRKLPR